MYLIYLCGCTLDWLTLKEMLVFPLVFFFLIGWEYSCWAELWLPFKPSWHGASVFTQHNNVKGTDVGGMLVWTNHRLKNRASSLVTSAATQVCSAEVFTHTWQHYTSFSHPANHPMGHGGRWGGKGVLGAAVVPVLSELGPTMSGLRNPMSGKKGPCFEGVECQRLAAICSATKQDFKGEARCDYSLLWGRRENSCSQRGAAQKPMEKCLNLFSDHDKEGVSSSFSSKLHWEKCVYMCVCQCQTPHQTEKEKWGK